MKRGKPPCTSATVSYCSRSNFSRTCPADGGCSECRKNCPSCNVFDFDFVCADTCRRTCRAKFGAPSDAIKYGRSRDLAYNLTDIFAGAGTLILHSEFGQNVLLHSYDAVTSQRTAVGELLTATYGFSANEESAIICPKISEFTTAPFCLHGAGRSRCAGARYYAFAQTEVTYGRTLCGAEAGQLLVVTQLLFAVVIFGRMAGDFHEQGGVCHGVAINLRQLPLAAHHSNTGEVERSVASTRTFKSEEDTRQRSARALPSDRIIASRQIRVSRCSASHRIDLTFAVLEFNLADLKRAEVFVVMVVDPASRAHDHFIVLGRGV